MHICVLNRHLYLSVVKSLLYIEAFKDENLPRSAWQLARVSAVYLSSDGQVRKVQVALADSCLDNTGKRVNAVRYLERPVQKLVLLMSAQTD